MKSETEFKMSTPILYLVFNRPDIVKQTFPEIQKAEPKQLFIASDGPRNSEEKKKTEAIRKYILENINWECEVKTLFREKNLGCKYAVSGAIDWFFENVEQGIILEDDCLPNQSFFRFCQEMLWKYRKDKQIGQISGTNFLKRNYSRQSYIFSKYGSIWGWATWKRAWENYDVDLKDFENFEKIKFKHSLSFFEKQFRRINYNKIKKEHFDTWDYQWNLIKNRWGLLSIVSQNNLIKNIGFGIHGTHTRRNLKFKNNFTSIPFPLAHPAKIQKNKIYDRDYTRKIIVCSSIKASIKYYINLLNRSLFKKKWLR
jgi:hypothetical protein